MEDEVYATDEALYGILFYMREEIIEYIKRGRPMGSFLTAIFINDFVTAYQRADITNQDRLSNYARFLAYHAPTECWGSRDTVERWIAQGGLEGKAE